MNISRPQVKESLCTRCGLCIEACPCGAVELQEAGPVFSCPEVCALTDLGTCTCGCLCEEVCPTGAISCAYEIVLDEGDCQPRPKCTG